MSGLILLYIRREYRIAILFTIFCLVYLVTCLVFFVSGEYRHPISFILCILSGYSIYEIVSIVKGYIKNYKLAKENKLKKKAKHSDKSKYKQLILNKLQLKKALIQVFISSIIAFVIFIPLTLYTHKELESSSAITLDIANYAIYLSSYTLNKNIDEKDFDRAEQLLNIPEKKVENVLIILENELFLYCNKAKFTEKREDLEKAINIAKELWSQEFDPAKGDYPETYIYFIFKVLSKRIVELYDLDLVNNYPDLKNELMYLGGNRYLEIVDLFQKQEFASCLQFIKEALIRAPHNVWLMAQMGQVLLVMGKNQEGLDWLKKSCQGYPRLADCPIIVGKYHLMTGNLKEAKGAFEEALRREPNNQTAMELLKTNNLQ